MASVSLKEAQLAARNRDLSRKGLEQGSAAAVSATSNAAGRSQISVQIAGTCSAGPLAVLPSLSEDGQRVDPSLKDPVHGQASSNASGTFRGHAMIELPPLRACSMPDSKGISAGRKQAKSVAAINRRSLRSVAWLM